MLHYLFYFSVGLSLLGVICAVGTVMPGVKTDTGFLPRIGRSSKVAIAFSAYQMASVSYLSSLLVFAATGAWFAEYFHLTHDRYSDSTLLAMSVASILLFAAAFFCWIWSIGIRKHSPWLMRKKRL